MSSLRPSRGKEKDLVLPLKWPRHEGVTSNQSDFESKHFLDKHLAKRSCQKFITRTIFSTFYILHDWLCSISISNINLLQLFPFHMVISSPKSLNTLRYPFMNHPVNPLRVFGDEAVCALRFEWRNGA